MKDNNVTIVFCKQCRYRNTCFLVENHGFGDYDYCSNGELKSSGKPKFTIDDVEDALVSEGQDHSSKYGFKLGDLIKFTPSQVADILRSRFQ